MSQVLLISDLHLFHNRVLEFEKVARPFSSVEEMNEHIVDSWNNTVKKRDTVWVLGDVCFGKPENLAIMDRMVGQKNLILGNHDEFNIQEYAKYFKNIAACRKYDGYILSHIPIHESQFYRFKGNVHGHLHSNRVQRCVMQETGIGMYSEWVDDTRYFNVSCEQLNFKPMPWSEIKKRMTINE